MDLVPIHGAPLRYAPENEQGVVAIFSAIAKSRLGMTIELIRTGYPDCEVIRRGDRIRVEFEFRSRNFKPHLLNDPKAKQCDAIVCWIHDWPAVPDHVEVIELRGMFGVGRNVWVQPYAPEMADRMSPKKVNGWSVPASAAKGDVVLVYRSQPDQRLEHVFRITSPAFEDAHWAHKKKTAVYANLVRIGDLPTPIPLQALKSDRALRHAPFVRNSFAGPQRLSGWWPTLRDLAISLDPKNEKVLSECPGDFCG